MADKNRRLLSYPMFSFKEEGDRLIGRIVERSTVEIEDRTIGKYVIAEEEKGTLWLVHGSIQLDEALNRSGENALLEITYQGTTESASGYPVKVYEVYELDE